MFGVKKKERGIKEMPGLRPTPISAGLVWKSNRHGPKERDASYTSHMILK